MEKREYTGRSPVPQASCTFPVLPNKQLKALDRGRDPKQERILQLIRKARTSLCLDLGALGIPCIPKVLFTQKMLSKLSLATNDLQALPAAVGHLQALEELDLSFNQLCELPETIGKLKKLKTLNCEWNRLQNVPASFSRCTAMERLLLNDNCLEKVCDLSRLFGLRDLCLHNNRLSTLPAGVETLRRLRSVRLEGNAWPLQMRKAALQGTEAVLSLLRGDSVHREEEAVAACRDQGKKEGSRPNRESSALGRRTEVPSAGTVLQGHQGEGGDGVNKVETGGGAGGGFMQRTEATETEKVVSFRRGMEEDKSPPRLLPPPSSLVPPSSSSSAEATPVSFRDLLEDLEERQRKHAELDKRVQRSTGDLGRAGRKKATGAFKKIFPSGAREDSMQPEKNATVSLSRLLLDPLCLPASKNNRRSPPPPLTQAPPSNQSLPLPPGLVCLESGSGSRVKIWEDPSVSSHDKGRAPQGPPRGRGLQERNARTRRNRSPMQQSGQMNLSATSCAAAQRGSLRPSSLKEQTPETAPQSLLSEKGLRHRVPLHGLSKRKGKEAYTDSAPPASPRACRSRAADTERGHRGPPEFSSRESGTVTASTTASGSFCVSMQQSTNCIFRRSTKESASRFESSASHEEAAVQTCTEKEEPRCAVGWTEEEKEEKIEVLVPVQPASSRSPSLPTLSVTQTLPSSPEASPSPPKGSLSVWKKGTDESSREAARKGIGWDMWQTTGKNTEEIGHGGDIKEGETSEKPRGEAMAGPTDADMTQEVCGVLREEGGKERIEQDEGGGAVLRRLKEMAVGLLMIAAPALHLRPSC
uniref:Disease resistance R13L4/SHOC-2-like LRR domain-containing protein n=1 Tax=Chromera velia CCMP2878 TaxID=1169474 RepID=A0A0G4FUU7_9ALVE|eukprot:Cvel_18878.t1-p1 / transcript=Cvel_18878.t1 / gene=Cvel_18878 / organism=Chromera_velia_CCMP2878 / gene_product=Malignant fibrous histiocytoma-amplified sequence 1, putative / transcript_product=Malignant fibrous histiocytoma-amplified sequence 1, putative / location=Cvel_scaffold1589:31462-34405(-) / protein_length=812 / sequence_SO=supercontig / SO=protein_coding / is_pseudo=false